MLPLNLPKFSVKVTEKAAVTGGNQAAVDSLKSEAKTYMLHPAEWYRFNDRILIYNTRRDKWEEAVRSQDVARAGAALKRYH